MPASTHLFFIRPADSRAPGADYVARLLAQLAECRVTCIAPEQLGESLQNEDSALVLLHSNQPVDTVPSHLKALRIARDDKFWSTLPATQAVAPPKNLVPLLEAAAARDLSPHLSQGSTSALNGDIIAACLYMVTRAEEYDSSSKLDEHGRFLASSSVVPAAVYDTPVVARALLWMWRWFTGELDKPAVPSVPGQQTVCLTHDVDLLRKYGGGAGLKRLLGRMARNPRKAAASAKAALPIMLGSGRDPYDSFDNLFSIKDRISAPSTWFLMAEQGSPNADYALNDPVVRNLLVRGRGFHDEIALHTSWDSGDSAQRIQKERSTVEQGTASNVRGARPHYLRFTLPDTWRTMSEAGLRYSSSMAFPDRAGFRCGWSGPFRPFDLKTMQELPIIEIPLVCMDISLSVYEKVPAELALERLTNLLDASCEGIPGGAFVFLWHNTIADRSEHPGYWDTFEYFFSIASGSSTFVTLNQLCDDFETRTAKLR